jgi:RND family efflux transporter MFP subunit
VSKIYVTVGNLVTGGVGNGTPLTTLVSVDPLYCYVPVPERTLLRYQGHARDNNTTVRDGKIGCAIQLENETEFLHKGVIDFVDNSVDPATGTIQMRGLFRNPDALLTPGLFARMRIEGGTYKALLAPDAAVQTDQNEHYVLTVDANDSVRARPVELGQLFGDMRVIEKGLEPRDRVIVNGLQMAAMLMAMPGAKVNVMDAPAAGASGTTGAATTTGS